METIEKQTLECWFRYVDETFIIWPHGCNNIRFLDHINEVHPDISFTLVSEENGCPLYLNVLVRPDNTLGHSVYRKPTHTNRYLNAESHHHLAQKKGIVKNLVHRVQIICEPEHFGGKTASPTTCPQRKWIPQQKYWASHQEDAQTQEKGEISSNNLSHIRMCWQKRPHLKEIQDQQLSTTLQEDRSNIS